MHAATLKSCAITHLPGLRRLRLTPRSAIIAAGRWALSTSQHPEFQNNTCRERCLRRPPIPRTAQLREARCCFRLSRLGGRLLASSVAVCLWTRQWHRLWHVKSGPLFMAAMTCFTKSSASSDVSPGRNQSKNSKTARLREVAPPFLPFSFVYWGWSFQTVLTGAVESGFITKHGLSTSQFGSRMFVQHGSG